MRILLTAVLLFPLFSAVAKANSDVQCPYEAVVDADDLHVRSGPGTKYYPTGKLQSGQKVTVRRLDPGGWLMIDPPEGTTSLIPAAAVERTGTNSGSVTEDQVKVVMGSEQDQARAVTQCELNHGDTVEILGEKILSLGGPAETWYQIRPPQGEYRWVHGKYIVPVDAEETVERIRKDRRTANELKKPSKEAASEFSDDPVAEPAAKKPSHIDKSGAVAHTGPDLDVLVAEREKLKAVDREWELMLDREPGQWHLDEMEKAYKQLQAELTIPVLQRQIDYRLRSLNEYREVYADYADFRRITEATDRRDRELREGFSAPVVQPVGHESAPGDEDLPAGAFPEASESTQPAEQSPAVGEAQTAAPQSEAPANPNQFVLTGRLVRTTPAGARPGASTSPQFALVAPNNQVLAFLHSTPQVGDLSPYLNREIGINGSNWSRPGQQTNVYSVTQIAPLDGPLVRDSSTPQFAMPAQQPGLPGPVANGQPLMSQSPQQPLQQTTGYQAAPGMQPIPSQFQQLPNGSIQPVSGEQPQQGQPSSGEQFQTPLPAQSFPQQSFSASQGMPTNGAMFSDPASLQNFPPTGTLSTQGAGQPYSGRPTTPPGQWQPAGPNHMQPQSGQIYRQGNTIYRPAQQQQQRRGWWPFGRQPQTSAPQQQRPQAMNPLP